MVQPSKPWTMRPTTWVLGEAPTILGEAEAGLYAELTGAAAAAPVAADGPVGTWRARTGQNLVAFSDAKRPLMRETGGRRFVEPDQVDDELTVTTVAGAGGVPATLTYCIVYFTRTGGASIDSRVAGWCHFAFGTQASESALKIVHDAVAWGAADPAAPGTANDGVPRIWTQSRTGPGASVLYHNAETTPEASNATGTPPASDYFRVASGSGGRFAAFVGFNRLLTEAERLVVVNKLNRKYHIF